MNWNVPFFLLMTLSLMGCQDKAEEASPSILEWEPSPKYSFKSKPKAQRTSILRAPALSGHRTTVSGFEKQESLSESVSIKIERAWREGDKRKVIVALENTSSKGTRADFYLFSHDERGLLIDVKQEEIFFNPYESVFKSFEFLDSAKAKSWSMSVK